MNDYPQPPHQHDQYQQQPAQPAAQTQRSGGGAGISMVSAVIGGAIVAAVFAGLIALGVIGGKETTVVQSGGIAAQTVGDGNVKTVGSIYKQTSPGIVSIRANVKQQSDSPFGQDQEGTASGTGFVISDKGYIVTNAHVVDGAQGAIKVTFNDEKTVDGKLIGSDQSNDIAVVQVDPDDHKLSPIEFGDSSKMEVGDQVVAIGNPFGLNQTVTTGIVSALDRTIEAPNGFQISGVIQTDAAINPGNSGGPLLDGNGRVIGVNSQIATSGGNEGNVGIGFAVPIDKVKQIVPDLQDDGKVEYAYMGVTTGAITADAAKRLNLGDRTSGALVSCVVNDGPADKAGIRDGGPDEVVIDGVSYPIGADLIIKIDDQDVKTSADVASVVTAKKPGDEVKVTVIRNGDEKTETVKLGSRPEGGKTTNCTPGAEQQPEPDVPGLP